MRIKFSKVDEKNKARVLIRGKQTAENCSVIFKIFKVTSAHLVPCKNYIEMAGLFY